MTPADQVVDDVHAAITGVGLREAQLFAALRKLDPNEAAQFRETFRSRYGEDPIKRLTKEWRLSVESEDRASSYCDGDRVAGDAIGLHQAFSAGDGPTALSLLKGLSAESIDGLMHEYTERYGRDIEYDMRGFWFDLEWPPRGLDSPLRQGLEEPNLSKAFRLLHGPRIARKAVRIAELTSGNPESTLEGRREIYSMLALAGGEERNLLAESFRELAGLDLTQTLRILTSAAVRDNARKVPEQPSKAVAIVVSSGNWKDILDGRTKKHVGGYHWREVEAYAKEALDRGYICHVFTPYGLPPSPDSLSLLRGKFGPKLGFGVSRENGPDSPQAKSILEGFAAPGSLQFFDPQQFATIHIAGGHGSYQDIVGNPLVETAARGIHERGRIVTAVCHATPALGRLLEGGPATGFSPTLDAICVRMGLVLPEFNPPYDAHQGLREIGARLTKLDSIQALANPNHSETHIRNGFPIVTGTGPEATDDVAKMALDWLDEIGAPMEGGSR